jgi:hypothetical protein
VNLDNGNQIPQPEKLSKMRVAQQQLQQPSQSRREQQQQRQDKQQSLPLENAVLCNFDGHCPIGTTCVGHSLSSKGGVCQEYRPSTRSELLQPPPSASAADDRFNACVQKCRTELEWDEHYYFYDDTPELNTIPHIHNTLPASSNGNRPAGCLLVFERVPGINKTLVHTTREQWMEARSAQHIVRVDPLVEGDFDQNNYIRNMTFNPPALYKSGVLWTAFCYLPLCKTDADCGNHRDSNNNNNFHYCDQSRRVCDRHKPYWTQYNNASKTILVTGANQGYFSGLSNIAASARFWAPDNPMVVYNLGLTDEQLETVKTWRNVIAVEWKDGIPYQQKHVQMLHTYAWKSLAINESVHKYHNIFWLDAGATYTGPIDGLEHYLQRHGIFLVRGQDLSMKEKSHPDTYKYLNLDKKTFVGGPHYAGGIQGHLLPSRYIDTIVKPNAACALKAQCIAPDGSNLGVHRYDQTTLSILAYGLYQQIPHHTEFLAASSNQLDPDLTKPNSMFMWTARQSCIFYSNRENNNVNRKN